MLRLKYVFLNNHYKLFFEQNCHRNIVILKKCLKITKQLLLFIMLALKKMQMKCVALHCIIR